jgi:hypothetical protein
MSYNTFFSSLPNIKYHRQGLPSSVTSTAHQITTSSSLPSALKTIQKSISNPTSSTGSSACASSVKRLEKPKENTGPYLTCQTFSEHVKKLTLPQIRDLAHTQIPTDLLPSDFIDFLDSEFKKITCYQLCLLCWHVTSGAQCPKRLQLEFACAVILKRDVFLEAGTGFGKTLACILPQLLNDKVNNGVTMIISPLKRLQLSQVSDILHCQFHFMLLNFFSGRCYL